MRNIVLSIIIACICCNCDLLDDDSPLNNQQVIDGLREALTIGADVATKSASVEGGFFGNEKIRIPLPEEAEILVNAINSFSSLGALERIALEATLNLMGAPGLSMLISDASSLHRFINRAAEEAAKSALNIFTKAIAGMSITDGFEILNGADNAATEYLRRTTTEPLTEEFTPFVSAAINTVGLGTLWNTLASTYNNTSSFHGGDEVDPNLEDYITSKAIDGLMTLIAEQELKIRQDPAARVSELLKKVFGNN